MTSLPPWDIRPKRILDDWGVLYREKRHEDLGVDTRLACAEKVRWAIAVVPAKGPCSPSQVLWVSPNQLDGQIHRRTRAQELVHRCLSWINRKKFVTPQSSHVHVYAHRRASSKLAQLTSITGLATKLGVVRMDWSKGESKVAWWPRMRNMIPESVSPSRKLHFVLLPRISHKMYWGVWAV
jgi:hypothetical protein